MKRLLAIVCLILLSNTAVAATDAVLYSLGGAIEFALKNNPKIRSAKNDVEIEIHRINAARAEKLPSLNLTGGTTRYRYASPVTPISGSPFSGAGFPEFDNNIYDVGISFSLPLYKGGRLDRAVNMAGIKMSIAEDVLQMSRRELVYNITSVYYKILQLEKLLEASEASVRQMEEHKKDVEVFIKAGTAPMVERLKTDVELAHARQNAIAVRNNIESAHELMKALMGVDDISMRISVINETSLNDKYPAVEESLSKAFSQRPDYRAVSKKLRIAEERVRLAEGKRLPIVYLTSEYAERSGDRFEFRENWNMALRMSLPIFDGGIIRSEIEVGKKEYDNAGEEERSSRIEITREIKDSYLNVENAVKRIEVSEKAIEEAKENLRIERLRYETGAGTSTDVIDAQAALLRAETEFYQALYDKNIAIASLRKAIGEDMFGEASR